MLSVCLWPKVVSHLQAAGVRCGHLAESQILVARVCFLVSGPLNEGTGLRLSAHCGRPGNYDELPLTTLNRHSDMKHMGLFSAPDG